MITQRTYLLVLIIYGIWSYFPFTIILILAGLQNIDPLYVTAARIDGASNWIYLWRMMVPIGKPAFYTIGLLNAILTWNAFFWIYLIINSSKNRTLPLGFYAFITDGGVRYEKLMAAATIVVVPIIILFLFARKNIVAGVSRGGMKG